MDDTKQARRFRHLTPGHMWLAVVFSAVGLLLLSQWLRWLPNGCPAMVAIGLLLVTLLLAAVLFGINVLFRWHKFSLRVLMIFVTATALAIGLAKTAWEFLSPEEDNESITSFSPGGEFRCTIVVPPFFYRRGLRPEVVIDKRNAVNSEEWDEVQRAFIPYERGSSVDWEYDSKRHTTGMHVSDPDIGKTIWRTILAVEQ